MWLISDHLVALSFVGSRILELMVLKERDGDRERRED
jgi:hypothetical protein